LAAGEGSAVTILTYPRLVLTIDFQVHTL